MSRQVRHFYEFGPFRLDPSGHTLWRGGRPVPLRPKVFDLLLVLVERHGDLVEKDELIGAVWPGQFVEEGNLNKTVSMLRQALGEVEGGEPFVSTVPKRGYRFAADVRRVVDDNGGGGGPELVVEERPPHANLVVEEETDDARRSAAGVWSLVGEIRGHKTFAGVALLTLLIGALALAYFAVSGKKANLGARGKKSIAILPLKPINAANRDEIIEVGIADSLINQLSSTKGLVVRPLSATRRYTDVGQDPLAAGREQQADYVLASNYQLSGGKIRITAQLIGVRSGEVEETYKSEKDAGDVFAMEDAVAAEVGELLLARFATTVSGPAAKRGTDNEEAYRLYLQGMYIVDIHTPSASQKAVELLERAVELDPDYAQAWAGKAYAHRGVANFIGRNASVQEDTQKSMEAIKRALSLDENLAEAYSTLCENKMYYEYNFVEAESACKRGIELNPNSPLAHQVYSRYLTSRGRFDEAITEIKTTIDLEPASLFDNSLYGIHFYYARRYPEAVAQFKRVLAMDENFGNARYWLYVTLAAQGNEVEAFEIFMKGLALDKADEATVQALQMAYRSSGWRGVMQEQAKQFEQGEERYFDGAIYNAQAGNKDKAFEYLEKSYRRREMWMAYLQVDPRLDPLRSDPRFDELVRRVGLQ